MQDDKSLIKIYKINEKYIKKWKLLEKAKPISIIIFQYLIFNIWD